MFTQILLPIAKDILKSIETDDKKIFDGNSLTDVGRYAVKFMAPDIFKFLVAANGHLVPADPMGIYYLSTRQSVTTNKKELENVQFIDSLEEYEKTFATSKCYEEMSE